MQGKQHIREINRKARGIGKTNVDRRGLFPLPQALAENRWAGHRDASKAVYKLCLLWVGGEAGKEAQDECSDQGLTAHQKSLG